MLLAYPTTTIALILHLADTETKKAAHLQSQDAQRKKDKTAKPCIKPLNASNA